jgi:hypothetical protein
MGKPLPLILSQPQQVARLVPCPLCSTPLNLSASADAVSSVHLYYFGNDTQL